MRARKSIETSTYSKPTNLPGFLRGTHVVLPWPEIRRRPQEGSATAKAARVGYTVGAFTRHGTPRQTFHDVEADKFYLIEKGGRVSDARFFRTTAVR
jgi:hypothetical protein